MSPDRTRRELLADAGRVSLAGSLLAPIGGAPAHGARAAQAVPAPDLPTQSGWTNDDYWAFADWAMTAADPLWNESTGAYGSDIRTSAAMLAAFIPTPAATGACPVRRRRSTPPTRASAVRHSGVGPATGTGLRDRHSAFDVSHKPCPARRPV